MPLLASCVTFPTSARLESIRAQLLGTLEQDVAQHNFQPGAPTFIRIFKEEAVLELWMKDTQTKQYGLYKTYPICALSNALGPKLQEGDRLSPEGFYSVSAEWLWPSSDYHLAMNIGFPNEHDQSWGRTGSHLMVHGGCKSEGCFAMTDRGIEEIYLLVEQSLRNGNASVPIHIFPFRMSEENIARHVHNRWLPFWMNLKQGYDAFEETRIPPRVGTQNYRYIFQRASGRYET